MNRRFVALPCCAAAALLAGPCAQAGEWSIGPSISYISGMSDVIDLYERNLEAPPFAPQVDIVSIPIGVAFLAKYRASSGVLFHGTVGPAFAMIGDNVDHFEFPLIATIGYGFSESEVAPYVRVGGAIHLVEGDFEVSSDPGLFAAFGVEVDRGGAFSWGLELSLDDSSVEFLDATVPGNTEINTYDVSLSFFMLF